ncbi:MAG: hypothetical protein CMF71_03125 [Magnetovibrio sp.]|nr:hypothetical protein [Magnetovibrio sp.]MBH89211.1 hypothetical protein [Magnetovibrio sp.]
MAEGIETLIRLNDWNVDQKRRKLGDLQRLIEGFEAELKKLEQDLLNEQAAATAAPNEGGFVYGYYAERVIERRAIIQISIQQLEKDTDEAREALSVAYRELKKFETALESRKLRQELELARKDQLDLDEVGIQTFIQKLS